MRRLFYLIKSPFLTIILITMMGCGINKHHSFSFGGTFTVHSDEKLEHAIPISYRYMSPSDIKSNYNAQIIELKPNKKPNNLIEIKSNEIQKTTDLALKKLGFKIPLSYNVPQKKSKSSDTKPEGPMNLWQTIETLLGFVIGMAALVLGTNFFLSMLTIWSGIIAYKMNTSIKNLRYYKKESGLKTLSIITIIIGAITIALNLPQLSLLRILGIAGITLLIALALLGITKYLIFKFVK